MPRPDTVSQHNSSASGQSMEGNEELVLTVLTDRHVSVVDVHAPFRVLEMGLNSSLSWGVASIIAAYI
jgi:hypothetical protein